MSPDSSPIALITGSGRRLGRQIAYGLAEAGYDIILHSKTSVVGMHEARDHIVDRGRRAWCLTGDLALMPDIRAIGEEVRSIVPRLDVLVNNAGVFPSVAFEDVTGELWDATMAVNTRSMFFLSRECSGMLKDSHGCIVNMASVGAFRPWNDHIPYNVSKAGVLMLTRSLAKALAPDVRVNAIAPGIILVPGEEERRHIPEDRVPLGRYGTIDDLMEGVLFLLRARYLTGHILPLDGGMSQCL